MKDKLAFFLDLRSPEMLRARFVSKLPGVSESLGTEGGFIRVEFSVEFVRVF